MSLSFMVSSHSLSIPCVRATTHYLAFELFSNGAGSFHQGGLTLFRRVEKQQAVQDNAGGEDLFCTLKRQTPHSVILMSYFEYFKYLFLCVCVSWLPPG